jgi:outer membrane protein TolC
MRAQSLSLAVLALAVGSLVGCAGTPIAAEKTARDQVARIGAELRPHAAKPILPTLRLDSPPAEFILYAVLNHPAVEAAYLDWHAAVWEITGARSLPDPQFTFQADVANTIMTFMPGVMVGITERAKLSAMGNEAAARSGVAYRAYVTAVLGAAADVRKAWIELSYVEETRRLYLATIENLDQSLALAGTGFSTARGMASLDDMVRLQNLIAEHHTHHISLGDRAVAVRARFKSALGLAPSDPDPVWPQAPLVATPLPSSDELWRTAQASNAGLGAMRAMVEMAVAEVVVAQKARTPDFSLGAMADLKASPLMVRPTASLTLPIWRDKIEAGIAAAKARRDAAVARVASEHLMLAAEVAQMLYMVSESDRMIAYIDGTALPNLERASASAVAGYQSGMGKPTMIPEVRHMALLMRLERAKALYERERAVVDLSLLTAAIAPPGLPLLAGSAAPSH